MSDYQQVDSVFVNAGLNLRDTPDSLQPGQYRRLTNVRSFAEGSISTRPGRRWIAGFRDGKDVHTLVKLGRAIFSGSGTALYRNGAAVPTEFSGAPISWAKHRASDGDEKWLYVTDGRQFRMLAEDGSDIKWGITAPASKAVFAASADTGLLDSSVAGGIVYDWRVVYKNSRTGAKSNPSPVADGIAVVLKKAEIWADSSTDGQVDTIEFYRRGGVNIEDAQTTWRFVGSKANGGIDPTTNLPVRVQFTDNLPDSQAVFGFGIRLDNNVPFTSEGANGDAIREAPMLYVWGPLDGNYLFACGDPNRPGHVYWTNPGRPHSAAVENHIAVTGPDEPLMGGFVHGGLSYVWSREALYALDQQPPGSLVTFVPRKTFVGRGLSVPFGFAVGPLIWFFSKDGIYATDGQSPAEPFTETNIRPLFAPRTEPRAYVAPGALGEVAWPPYAITNTGFQNHVFEEAPDTPAARDFAVACTPTSAAGVVGTASTFAVAVTTDTFFNKDVILEAVGLPPTVPYTMTPNSGVPGTNGFSAVLSITPAVSGTFLFQVRARSIGGNFIRLSEQVTFTVTGTPAPPASTATYSMFTAPTSIAVPRGEGGGATLAITSANDFNAAVVLTASGAPDGMAVSFGSATVTPPANGTASTSVGIGVSGLVTLGTYQITITGTSGVLSQSAVISVTVLAASGDPTPGELGTGLLRMTWGGQFLHIHYKDILGQWVHLLNPLPYGRWSNDESPELPGGLGSVYETLSYYDDTQADTALLIGTNLGLVGLETGVGDYAETTKTQCRVREGSNTFGLPQTLKELGDYILDADCGDAVLPLSINPDQPTGLSVIPFLDAETRQLSYQRVAGTGRRKFPRAFKDSNGGEDLFGYSLGLDIQWNGQATIFGKTLLYHPDEELITFWSFGPTSHGLRGWQQVRDLYLMLKSNAIITPTVEIDGTSYPLWSEDTGATTIPSTGGEKRLVHLWAPPVKGKVYKWRLSGQAFSCYGNECSVFVKEVAAGRTYNLLRPFAGGTAEV